MKQTYSKPVLNIEDFKLSQTVAWGCGGEIDYENVNFNSHEYCGYRFDDGTVYFIDKKVCNDTTLGDSILGVVCYNNPEGGYALFRS